MPALRWEGGAKVADDQTAGFLDQIIHLLFRDHVGAMDDRGVRQGFDRGHADKGREIEIVGPDLVAALFEPGLKESVSVGARMRRSEILLHVALHWTYHRGNAGAVLQLKGLSPGPDAITDYLEDATRT